MERVLIFANPIAGRGRGQAIARRLKDQLAAQGHSVRTLFDPADAVASTEFHQNPVGVVIVVGGDGTLRTVANRLMAEFLATPPPLLVVPLGTANLMGQHLGIRWDPLHLEQRVLAAMQRRRIVHLDAARANGRLFLLVAGVGFDAHIVHEVGRRRRGPIHMASYLLPAARAVRDYLYPPITVTVDGRRMIDSTPAMAFISNIPEYGTGFPLLPHARPDDGALDVCIIPCQSRRQLVSLFLHAAAGEHLEAEGVAYCKAQHIVVESSQSVPVQIDGEPAGHTPLRIDLLPVRIPFIVP